MNHALVELNDEDWANINSIISTYYSLMKKEVPPTYDPCLYCGDGYDFENLRALSYNGFDSIVSRELFDQTARYLFAEVLVKIYEFKWRCRVFDGQRDYVLISKWLDNPIELSRVELQYPMPPGYLDDPISLDDRLSYALDQIIIEYKRKKYNMWIPKR